MYPAITKEEGSQVRGRVLWIEDAELAKLDHYESDEYIRQSVTVRNCVSVAQLVG